MIQELSVSTRLLKPGEVAKLLQTSLDCVYDYIRDGALPAINITNANKTGLATYRIDAADLAAFLKTRTTVVATPSAKKPAKRAAKYVPTFYK